MEEIVGLAVQARLSRVIALNEGAFHTCYDAAATAYVNCFPEPVLAEVKLCFVQLEDKECWPGDLFNFESVAWRALTRGREMMCDAVDARLVAQAYTDTEVRRVECRARCEAKVLVRCL